MLADPAYFQAVFHSLERVRSLFQAQAELGMANESIASASFWTIHYLHGTERSRLGNNLALQDNLHRLRNETQEAFNEAKALEERWKDLEREQRDVYQVCTTILAIKSHILFIIFPLAILTPILVNAPPTRNHSARRKVRRAGFNLCPVLLNVAVP
jgi:hypothetical protein